MLNEKIKNSKLYEYLKIDLNFNLQHDLLFNVKVILDLILDIETVLNIRDSSNINLSVKKSNIDNLLQYDNKYKNDLQEFLKENKIKIK